MTRQLALLLYFILILWLFTRDRKLRPMASPALWLPLLWIAIIGSRPVTLWLGGGFQVEVPDDYLDGSPLDRDVFLFFIVAGMLVLLRRGANWGRIVANNRWIFAFFVYCGISVIWSDYAFVGFKRWIKDLGNVLMVLVLLTEEDPIEATRAVFARFTYFVIPLSVIFIKYFPELGRYYHRWTWRAAYCGVTTEKNALGCIAFICGLFLVWDLIEIRTSGGRKTDSADLWSRIVLLLMVFWVIDMAESSTALVCLILGSVILLFARLPRVKRQVRHLGTYSLAAGFIVILLYSFPGILGVFIDVLGKDMTLTGRTELWTELLREPINPLFGTGYQSFWLGPRAQRYWETWSFRPNQAHNGYLETYLNGGLLGLCLIMAMIVSTGSRLKKELLQGSGYGILRFTFLAVTVFYNWTEAVFNRLSPVWFILLVAALNYSRPSRSEAESMTRGAELIGALSERESRVPVSPGPAYSGEHGQLTASVGAHDGPRRGSK